jgi:hypothetical protein
MTKVIRIGQKKTLDGELVLVTPDAGDAIIEVKTS